MKRLWTLTAIAIISAGTIGCCGSGRSWCGRRATSYYAPCPTCPTTGPCDACGTGGVYGESYVDPGAANVLPGPVTN